MVVQTNREPAAEGNVLGIDVGWSEKKASSAICRLSWTREKITWKVCRYRAIEDDRCRTIKEASGENNLLGVAIDGPLRSGFNLIERYRSAERILSRGNLAKQIGKPGQSSSPNGKKLNEQANLAAQAVRHLCCVQDANHDQKIDEKAIVEAFPTSFLGVMVPWPDRLSTGARSDRYFAHLDGYLGPQRSLSQLIENLIGPKKWGKHIHSLTNHDDRAAFVCAITALCIACGEYTAVGDSEDGWIILPPKWAFEHWAWRAIHHNEKREKKERNPRQASLICYSSRSDS